MSENRCSCAGGGLPNISTGKESVCIDTYRVLDSCRDKDCYENARVYLTDFGQEILNHTSNIRTKCADILRTNIHVSPVQFNRGFYQIDIRYYVKIVFEACVGGGRAQEFDGVAVIEKKVILYGSEGCVSIYRSGVDDSFCHCDGEGANYSNNMPVATVEVADPVILGMKIADPHCCDFTPCCPVAFESIPESIGSQLGGCLCCGDDLRLYVSLGFFSIVRIERPAQYLINVTEYCVPDKECVVGEEDDPCSLFRSMSFPIQEFYPPSLANTDGGCGCRKK